MITLDLFVILRNGQTAFLDQVPHRDLTRFHRFIVDAVANGWRVAAFFGAPKSAPSPLPLPRGSAPGHRGGVRVPRKLNCGRSSPTIPMAWCTSSKVVWPASRSP